MTHHAISHCFTSYYVISYQITLHVTTTQYITLQHDTTHLSCHITFYVIPTQFITLQQTQHNIYEMEALQVRQSSNHLCKKDETHTTYDMPE